MTTPIQNKSFSKQGDEGFDNPRENIDPHIKTKVLSYLEFEKRWDDLRTPLNALKLSATKPPVWTAYKGSEILAFEDQAINEQVVYFVIQFPHSMKLNSNVRPHFHFVPEDNTAGNARFLLTYSWADKEGIFPGESSETISVAMPGIADKHILQSFTEIDGSAINGISSMMLCSLTRKSSDILDTYNGKYVGLLEVDFHYESNSSGSRQELVK